MSLLNFLKISKDKPVEPPQEKLRILVVDDDTYLNDFYVELLTSEGYQVNSAFNGQEALDLIAKNPPHLILLDIMMPVLNGNEVLERLKADEKTQKIPVIMLTNAGNIDNMENAHMHNTVNFFIKSNVVPPEIIQGVKAALNPELYKKKENFYDKNFNK